YLPGPVSRTGLIMTMAIFGWLPSWLPRQQPAAEPPRSYRYLWVALLLFTILLRWPNLGYKELQGDEGIVMNRAAAALLGDDNELFLHQKGPIEILLPMMIWQASGAIHDLWLKVPFAIASTLTVFVVASLGSFLWQQPDDQADGKFAQRAGLLAGYLMAICGFSVAFGRIIQYQSWVLFWGCLALLWAAIYQRRQTPLALLLSTFFLAGALLAHYDAVLFLPACAWMLAPPLSIFGTTDSKSSPAPWRAPQQIRQGLRRLIPEVRQYLSARGRQTFLALMPALLTTLVFYLPYVLHPNFADTRSYLLNDRVGAADSGGPLNWSVGRVWQMVTFYNSSYYIIGLLILILLVLAAHRRGQRRRVGLNSLLVWLVPFIFYTVVVVDPRTHVYTFFPGAVILAAGGLADIWTLAGSKKPLLASGLLIFWLVLSGWYVWLLFTDVSVERQRNWADARPAGYPVTWAEPPEYGLFGFPYQAGWRAAAGLIPDPELPYASNEESEVTGWDMGNIPRTHCADYQNFLWTDNVQDEIPFDEQIVSSLTEIATVTVNNQPRLHIYDRQSLPFVSREASSLWRRPEEIAGPVHTGDHPLNIVLGQRIMLLGYDLDKQVVAAGDQFTLVLYWLPLVPLERNYQVLVHVTAADILAQGDGTPECGFRPTSGWEVGRPIRDPHLVTLPTSAPPGEYNLFAGLYDLETLERLDVAENENDLILLEQIELTSDPLSAD
ncbi:MAG: hypothetical protein KDE59_23285, partial [Anaerolineales bacterium]|nr:hypothetical protein [Anaerolineales bacterium]